MKRIKQIQISVTVLFLILVLTIWQANISALDANEKESVIVFLPVIKSPIEVPADMLSVFTVLPAEATSPGHEITSERVDLGRMLFFDKRLSISQELNCASCHILEEGGDDNLATSIGHDGNHVSRNAPTVYNAAFHFTQFWDGREPDVEAQVKGPILAAGEMGMPSTDYVEQVIKSIPGYAPLFAAAFAGESDPITFENIAKAIGNFERKLVTPGRFDDFLNGESAKLTDAEKQGLITFVSVGCASCHLGPVIGGTMYRKMGFIKPYPTADLGRYEVTGFEFDKYVFKVPGLRNITETAPYLHDGSISTLAEMVHIMGEYELGQELTALEVSQIVTFLGALKGEISPSFIAEPILPANEPNTLGPYPNG